MMAHGAHESVPGRMYDRAANTGEAQGAGTNDWHATWLLVGGTTVNHTPPNEIGFEHLRGAVNFTNTYDPHETVAGNGN